MATCWRGSRTAQRGLVQVLKAALLPWHTWAPRCELRAEGGFKKGSFLHNRWGN